MQVLVYGEWENQSKNIIPFFTATYSESEKEIIEKRGFHQKIQFVFVGALVKGKNPLYAIQLVEQLFKNGCNVCLSLYGEGAERGILEQYISEKDLQSIVFLKGNNTHDVLKKAYQNSHFVILPSVSEGWPKAIAEGMFWGCVPLATKVSCVPTMIGNGSRGILLQENVELDLLEIIKVLQDESHYQKMALKSMRWSQQFTTDKFDSEIKKILIN